MCEDEQTSICSWLCWELEETKLLHHPNKPVCLELLLQDLGEVWMFESGVLGCDTVLQVPECAVNERPGHRAHNTRRWINDAIE